MIITLVLILLLNIILIAILVIRVNPVCRMVGQLQKKY